MEEKDPYTITELQIEKLPKIDLDSLYITKKIEASAFKTVLASTYQTAYRLYLITNSIKEIQTFYEVNHPDYMVMATVRTTAAVAGEARSQVWNVKHLQPLLKNKPRYTLKASITEKQTNKVLYRSHFVSVKESSMYNQVQQTIQELDEFFKSNE